MWGAISTLSPHQYKVVGCVPVFPSQKMPVPVSSWMFSHRLFSLHVTNLYFGNIFGAITVKMSSCGKFFVILQLFYQQKFICLELFSPNLVVNEIFTDFLFQICHQLDRPSRGAKWKSQLDGALWQVHSNIAGYFKSSLQKNHTYARHQPSNDAVPAPWLPPHTRECPTWQPKGSLWTIFCFCCCLGIWFCSLSRWGELVTLNRFTLMVTSHRPYWSRHKQPRGCMSCNC